MASRILAEKIGVWKVAGTYHESYDSARKAVLSILISDAIHGSFDHGFAGTPEEIGAALAGMIDNILAEAKEAMDKVPAASAGSR